MSEVGKQYNGQKHAVLKTEEVAAQEMEQQVKFDGPDAVDLVTYFAAKKISNPVMQAAMTAFVAPITRATFDQWDKLFKTF